MRILRIRLKNCSSLAGEWEVDLTDPAYADGIFCVTGPTGAGKSTLLDAVSLALYGCTPRLRRISKAENGIMSRRTGECFAEVTFSAAGGTYRCRWEQRRAYKKPDGELQPPMQELADAVTGRILESKIKDVERRITEITGMDYARFSRSMLLAQGDFAGFLQAPAAERAPLLEQITGTEIYGRLSELVHQRLTEERGKLDRAQELLEGAVSLAPEEEAALRRAAAEEEKREEELARESERNASAMNWLEGIARAAEEAEELDRHEKDAAARWDALLPEREQVRRALGALQLAAEYAELSAVRKEHLQDQERCASYERSLPGLEEAVRQAEEAAAAAAKALAAARNTLEKTEPLLRQVRLLDIRIDEKSGPVRTARAAADMLAGRLRDTEKEFRERSEAAAALRAEISRTEKWLAENADDESLQGVLPAVRAHAGMLSALEERLAGRSAVLPAMGSRLDELRREEAACEQRLADASALYTAAEERAEELRGRLDAVLDGKSLAEWNLRLSAAQERCGRYAAAADAMRNLEAIRDRCSESEKKVRAASETAASAAAELTAVKSRREIQGRLVSALEDTASLHREVESLREKRHRLRDGDPCPLCGSSSHPYVTGSVPDPGNVSEELASARSALAELDAEVVRLTAVYAAGEQEQILAEEEIISLKDEAGRKEAELAAALAEAGLPAYGSGLAAAAEASEHTVLQLRKQADEAARLQEENAAFIRELSDAAAKKGAAAQAAAAAAGAAQLAEASLQSEQREIEEGKRQREDILRVIAGLVTPYGCTAGGSESAAAVQKTLESRLAAWRERSSDRERLVRDLSRLENEKAQSREAAAALRQDLAARHAELEALETVLKAAEAERATLFAGCPEQEETRLNAAVSRTAEELARLEKEAAAARNIRHLTAEKLREGQQSAARRTAAAAEKEAQFIASALRSGFADEEDYRQAVQSDEERKRLQQICDAAEDELKTVRLRRGDKLRWLEAERAKALTDKPYDSLAASWKQLEEERASVQQRIGSLREKLAENDRVRLRSDDLRTALESQRGEYARWKKLHGLIGSADGRKYRSFAQGLTLEVMLCHANRELRKISDRYLLLRDTAQPLDICVLDNYQDGEVRPARSLSGGETFLVSLALALGLSGMVSENVLVESLFLDEGFGTLDAQALDTALDALAGLQHGDKLICAISHVPAVSARIPARIRAEPKGDGTSILSGPGCRRCS